MNSAVSANRQQVLDLASLPQIVAMKVFQFGLLQNLKPHLTFLSSKELSKILLSSMLPNSSIFLELSVPKWN